MQIYAKDLIFGDFRMSDYGLITVSESDNNGEESDEIFSIETAAEFIGSNPVRKYVGQSYNSNLEVTATFMKDPCNTTLGDAFTEFEIRGIQRLLHGKPSWTWLTLLPDDNEGEEVWYRARVQSMKHHRIGGKIMKISVVFSLDSYMGYTVEEVNMLQIENGVTHEFYIVSDDLYNYILPMVQIVPKSSGTLKLINISDNSWETELTNVTANQVITMDCQNKIITNHDLNEFNLHWPRLVNDRNQYTANMDVDVTFSYRLPRRGSFACR